MVACRLRGSFSASTLTRLREVPASDALKLLAVQVKPGSSYLPLKDTRSRRWHASTVTGDFEILTTGPKWYDTRARTGGGGAIDLAMHMLGLSFVEAVKRLKGGDDMVQIIRKILLPQGSEVIESLTPKAEKAHRIPLREPRPVGFPLLFTAQWKLIEPAVAFLHEHSVQRAHTADTLRTYAEILYDWFETLEQNVIAWNEADAVDLVAYRNRMLAQPSAHTGRPYRISTINHRVRGVLRFYEWAVRTRWLQSSALAGVAHDFAMTRLMRPDKTYLSRSTEQNLFVLRQFDSLPRPLASEQARDLLATLSPPYDLMARWQLYTGLRVSELLSLGEQDATKRSSSKATHHTIEVTRKGRKPGYVIAPASLLDETAAYLSGYRRAWLLRACRGGRGVGITALFVNSRGSLAGRNAYQRAVSRAGQACGFKATTHLLRATFACMLLARLEQLASEGAAINPLMIVKVLMGHERIETTDRYLRAIAVEAGTLREVLDTLLSTEK